MEIGDIEGVDRRLARLLADDGWTVSKLATAAPARLEHYPFIGPAQALHIVTAAGEMVNRQLDLEAQRLQAMAVSAPPPAMPVPPAPPAAVAERIRRIQESMAR